MVEDDVSYISLHQVYEDFCNRSGVHKDQAIDFYVKSVEEAMAKRTVPGTPTFAGADVEQDKDTKDWLNNVKMEIIQAIRRNIVPDTFLLDVPLCFYTFRLTLAVLQEDVHDLPRSLAFPQTIHTPIRNHRLPNLAPRNQQPLPAKTLLLPLQGDNMEYRNVALTHAQNTEHYQ